MRKNLLLLILLIIAALVASPYYFGMKAEKEYNQIISSVEKTGNIKIKKRQYERGIFNSKASTVFEYSNTAKQITFKSTDTITHGPLDFMGFKQGKIDFTPFAAKISSDSSINIPITTASGETKTLSLNANGNTDVEFDGTAEGEYIIPDYKIIKKDEDIVFDWSGLVLNFNYDKNAGDLSSNIVSKSLSVIDPETTFVVNNIKIKSSTDDMVNYPQSLNGNFQMNIGSVKLEAPDNKMTMDNINITGFSKSDKTKFQTGVKFTGEKMLANQTNVGPVVYEFSLKDIDTATWIKLQEAANSMKNSKNAMEDGMQLMTMLPELAKHSPVIEIKQLNIKSDLGNLDANAKVQLKGDKPEMLQNFLLIGNALEADASVTASKTLVDWYIENTQTGRSIDMNTDSTGDNNTATSQDGEKFIDNEMAEKMPQKNTAGKPSTLQTLIDNNYITPDGDNYKFNVTLKAGQVTINGKPIALTPMLLQ